MARFSGVSDGTMPANVNSLVALTLPKLAREITDVFFGATPFFRWLREKNRVMEWNGGDTLEQQLMMDKNPGARAYQSYEVLDVKPPQGFKCSIWSQVHYRVPIMYSRQTKVANSGQSQIVDLVEALKNQAELSLIDAINTDLFTSSQDALKINSMYHLLEENLMTAQVATPGGISKATYTWWRHQYRAVTSAASGILSAIRRLQLDCTNGADRPDFAVCDEDTYVNIEEKLQTAVRYVDTTMVDFGFENIKHKGVTITHDKSISGDGANGDGDGTMFWLNTNYIRFAVGDANFRVIAPEYDRWQDSYVGLVLVDCQLIVRNMARQGVLNGGAYASAC